MKRLFLQLLFLLSATSLCAADWPVLKTYEGAFLDRVKMPLGGIGTGTISLSGRGGLVDWEIFNEPSKGFVPSTSSRWPPICTPSFALRCETAEGTCAARLLEGPLPLSAYEGDLGSRAVNAGFPRFGKAVFKAAYPLAQVELSEGGLPVEAVLEAMNPLVPGDAWKSGIPAVLLRWRLTNRSAQPVKASIAGTLVNCCGRAPRFADRKTPVIRDEARVQARGLTGIRLAGRQVDSRRFRLLGGEIANAADGEFGLFVPEGIGTVTAATDVREPGWGVAMDRFWSRFVAQGDVADTAENKVAAPVKLPLAENAKELGTACADGQMQCIAKAYGFWRKTGDDAALRQSWPAIRRALSFAWIPGGWDADRDGVMEGCQHNTMDVEYYGPNPQIEFLYLAALDAAARLADACGDAAFAATCRDLFLVT